MMSGHDSSKRGEGSDVEFHISQFLHLFFINESMDRCSFLNSRQVVSSPFKIGDIHQEIAQNISFILVAQLVQLLIELIDNYYHKSRGSFKFDSKSCFSTKQCELIQILTPSVKRALSELQVGPPGQNCPLI